MFSAGLQNPGQSKYAFVTNGRLVRILRLWFGSTRIVSPDLISSMLTVKSAGLIKLISWAIIGCPVG